MAIRSPSPRCSESSRFWRLWSLSSLKIEGLLTAQIKGDGAVGVLVADATSAGGIRGFAQYDAEALARSAGWSDWRAAPVPNLIGAGHLAFTVDQGAGRERYQGIAGLEGPSLAECAQGHFCRSDQSQAVFKLAMAPEGGGLMMQRLSDLGGRAGRRRRGPMAPRPDPDGLLRAGQASRRRASSVRPPVSAVPRGRGPLLRAAPPAARLPLLDRPDRGDASVVPRREIDTLRVDDVVTITCEFCGRRYDFDDRALDVA